MCLLHHHIKNGKLSVSYQVHTLPMGPAPILILFNPTRALFMITLILGTVLALSSSSWLGCWVGLEINLLSFIPLINKKSQFAAEAALKYFLVQALASAILLMSALLASWQINLPSVDYGPPINLRLIIGTALLLKIGAAPLHFWFPGVIEGLDWFNNLVLITWQKIAPFILLSYVISNNSMFFCVIALSVLFGAVGGLNQTSLRKLMAYSSINHLGWIIAALMFSSSYWILYFSTYALIRASIVLIFNHRNLSHTLQIYNLHNNKILNLLLFCNLLSLGGLPPFLGFLPKWLVIQSMVYQGYLPLALFMVCFTLVALYFYARIAYPAFIISHSEVKWEPLISAPIPGLVIALSSLSLGGLAFSSLAVLII